MLCSVSSALGYRYKFLKLCILYDMHNIIRKTCSIQIIVYLKFSWSLRYPYIGQCIFDHLSTWRKLKSFQSVNWSGNKICNERKLWCVLGLESCQYPEWSFHWLSSFWTKLSLLSLKHRWMKLRERIIRDWRELYNQEHYKLYSSLLIGQLIKKDIGLCNTMGVTANEYKLGRSKHKWEEHIKMTPKIIWYQGVDEIQLTQDTDHWWAHELSCETLGFIKDKELFD
jgi:hypothetical protein